MRFMSNQKEFHKDFPRKVTQVVKITFNDFKRHSIAGFILANLETSLKVSAVIISLDKCKSVRRC